MSLLTALTVVTAVILAEVAALIYFKVAREKRETFETSVREAVMETLIDALDDDEAAVDIPAPRGLRGRATRDTLMALVATLSGSARNRLVGIMQDHGYVAWVSRHLRARNPVTRARGCMLLGGMLSARANAVLLDRMQNDRDANVRLTAAEALAEIGSPASVPALMEMLAHCSRWERLRIANAVSRMGITALPELMASLEGADETLLRLTLEILCDIAIVPEILPVLRLLKHPSPEIRGRAVELLGIAGAVDAMAHVVNRTRDGQWFVRVRAVKAMQRLGVPDDPALCEPYYDALQTLLGDDTWWVRRNAAEALARAGERGHEILAHSDSDVAPSALRIFALHEAAT